MAAEPVVAVVQARMGSTRFPGKTLAPFAGTTVLRHLLDRLRAVAHPLDLCVATTDLREDDAVVAECGPPALRSTGGRPTTSLPGSRAVSGSWRRRHRSSCAS